MYSAEMKITTVNSTAAALCEKINKLSSEIMNKNLLEKCTGLEKKRLLVMINEIKYDANRVKNYRSRG